MERKKEEGRQVLQGTPEVRGQGSKKAYQEPELREWGSIQDLTGGTPKPGADDGAGWVS